MLELTFALLSILAFSLSGPSHIVGANDTEKSSAQDEADTGAPTATTLRDQEQLDEESSTFVPKLACGRCAVTI